MPAGDYYNTETLRIRKSDDTFLHREQVCLSHLMKHMPACGTFVDLGCGTGWFLLAVQDTFPSVKTIGLEYSPDQVANKVSSRLDIRQADFCEPLPFEDSSVDTVYCGEIIEHLLNPDFFLKEVFRILKQNGQVVMTTPNLCAWHSRVLMLFGIQPICYEASAEDARIGFGPIKKLKRDSLPVGHLRLFSLRAIVDILKCNGFVITACRGTAFDYFHGPVYLFDRMLAVFPGIASGLMLAARRRNKDL